LIFDGYRPWSVTKIFWEVTPPDKHEFVANPAEGSKHNRGCAVDLSLYDLKTGREVEMPSVYDEMSEKSYPTYEGGTVAQRRARDLLRAAMEKEGFSVYPSEALRLQGLEEVSNIQSSIWRDQGSQEALGLPFRKA
jgi:D-alanyl-D-alanine dipeptidase